MTRFTGRVWRHVPVGAEPLHLGFILTAARGRWNSRRPRLPCLYTSLEPHTAVAEFEKHLAEYRAPTRRDLVSLDVVVGPVLNLGESPTLPRRLGRYGVTRSALTSDTAADLAACRALAREAILEEGYAAILAPSAARPEGMNLMIYLQTASLPQLTNGPDRITIGPGFRWPGA